VVSSGKQSQSLTHDATLALVTLVGGKYRRLYDTFGCRPPTYPVGMCLKSHLSESIFLQLRWFGVFLRKVWPAWRTRIQKATRVRQSLGLPPRDPFGILEAAVTATGSLISSTCRPLALSRASTSSSSLQSAVPGSPHQHELTTHVFVGGVSPHF
jgi:hypothetical protein